MRLIISFFKLIRWPNLFFIALTQSLFYFRIVASVDESAVSSNKQSLLVLILIVASIAIAAAGYIINDYFDLQIDVINKPDKVIVDSIIKRRWAIVWHWILSLTGLALTTYVSYNSKYWSILTGNVICVIALWFYSTTFKKKLLSGNIIISFLTAWTIIVMFLFSGGSLIGMKGWHGINYDFDVKRLFKLTMLYAGFAFIVTLIREVVKDLEDRDGDARYGCRTMPIVWGIPASKVFVAVWTIVCMASLAIIQLYAWQSGFSLSAIYVTATIIFPMAMLIHKLSKAQLPSDYRQISHALKFIMLAGILSMLFF